MHRRILVTGFAPWAEHDTNPSTELALAMNGLLIENVEFVTKAPLPVEFEGAERAAHDAAVEFVADAHLALGLAASSPFIRVERTGRNRSTTKVADNAGFVAHDVAILSGVSDTLATSFDAESIARSLVASGFDAQLSDDAGGYVCNDLYFRALARAVRPTIFVHVPSNAMDLTGLPEAIARAIAAAMTNVD